MSCMNDNSFKFILIRFAFAAFVLTFVTYVLSIRVRLSLFLPKHTSKESNPLPSVLETDPSPTKFKVPRVGRELI